MTNDSDEALFYIWSEREERVLPAHKDFIRWQNGPREGEAKVFTEADVRRIVCDTNTMTKWTGVKFRAIAVEEVSKV